MGIFGQDKKFNNKGPQKSSMHKAVCDKCGKDCEVPFKPTGDKPVFCSDCFKNRPNTDSRRGGGRDFRRGGSGDKKMYKAVCDKCGEDCEVPFRPTGGKPIYCSDCFGKSGGSSKSSGQVEKQLEVLNNKLDKILELLAPSSSKKETKKKKVTSTKIELVAKKVAKKPVAKKKATVKKK